MTHRQAWREIGKTISRPPVRTPAIAVAAAVTAFVLMTIVVFRGLALLDYHAQEVALIRIALGLAATPFLFILVPGSWLDRPRTLLFSWWGIPLGVVAGVVPYWGDMGPRHMFLPILVFLAALFAMFAPMIPIGTRRAVSGGSRSLRDEGDSTSQR